MKFFLTLVALVFVCIGCVNTAQLAEPAPSATQQPNDRVSDPYQGLGCSPHLSYRLQSVQASALPMGNILVHLSNASGSAVVNAEVMVSYGGHHDWARPAGAPIPGCIPASSTHSNSNGDARFERMKIGDYVVTVFRSTGDIAATASCSIEDGETAMVDLTY